MVLYGWFLIQNHLLSILIRNLICTITSVDTTVINTTGLSENSLETPFYIMYNSLSPKISLNCSTTRGYPSLGALKG